MKGTLSCQGVKQFLYSVWQLLPSWLSHASYCKRPCNGTHPAPPLHPSSFLPCCLFPPSDHSSQRRCSIPDLTRRAAATYFFSLMRTSTASCGCPGRLPRCCIGGVLLRSWRGDAVPGWHVHLHPWKCLLFACMQSWLLLPSFRRHLCQQHMLPLSSWCLWCHVWSWQCLLQRSLQGSTRLWLCCWLHCTLQCHTLSLWILLPWRQPGTCTTLHDTK